MNPELALELMKGAKTPKEARMIIEGSAYHKAVLDIGLAKLKLPEWTEPQLLFFMADSKYNEDVCAACAKFLTLKTLNNQAIFRLLNNAQNHYRLLEVAITALKPIEEESEEERSLLRLLYATRHEKVFIACQPLLKLDSQSEEDLMVLATRLENCSVAQREILSYINDPINLLIIIKNNQGNTPRIESVRKEAYKKLELDKKNDEELLALLKTAGYDQNVCQEFIKYLHDLSSVLFVLIKARLDYLACAEAMVKMPNDDYVMTLWEQNWASQEVSLAALSQLKSEDNINIIWDKHQNIDAIRIKAITSLPLAGKNEDELAKVIANDPYHDDAVSACLPYLHIEEKSIYQILAFLEKTEYHEKACQRLISADKLAGLSEEEILKLLKKNHFHENVAKVFINYLSQEKYILELIRKSDSEDSFWEPAFSRILEGKNDDQIFKILETTRTSEAYHVAVKHLSQRESIMKLLGQNNDKELHRIGLDRLKELE